MQAIASVALVNWRIVQGNAFKRFAINKGIASQMADAKLRAADFSAFATPEALGNLLARIVMSALQAIKSIP